MPNSTNTNPLPRKHTHEKEDIVGLSLNKKIKWINLLFDSENGKGYREKADSYLSENDIVEERIKNFSSSNNLNDYIEDGEIIGIHILKKMQDSNTGRYNVNDVYFKMSSELSDQQYGDVSGILVINMVELDSIEDSPIKVKFMEILNEKIPKSIWSYKSNREIKFDVLNENPINKGPNTLYFITET